MKGLKIVNIILLTLICALEAAFVYTFVTSIALLLSGGVGGIFAFIALFVHALIWGVAILVLNIIITLTTKAKIRKMEEQGLTKSKFDTVCFILPWTFLIVDAVAFGVFMIVSQIRNK